MASIWRENQKARLKEKLFDSALTLFKEQGYENTTVQQITEKAGVGKGTFFNHFPGKEHVVVEWYNRLTVESFDEVEARDFSTALEAIKALIRAMTDRALAEPDLIGVKARIVFSSDLLTHAERAQDERFVAFCTEWLIEAKKTGEVAPDLDELLFVHMLTDMLSGTTRSWVVSGHGFDVLKTLEDRLDFLFFAAAVPRT